MVGEQRPGVPGPGALLRHHGAAGEEVRAVRVLPEADAPLEPPHHDVVEGVGRIQAGLAGHGGSHGSTSLFYLATSRITHVPDYTGHRQRDAATMPLSILHRTEDSILTPQKRPDPL